MKENGFRLKAEFFLNAIKFYYRNVLKNPKKLKLGQQKKPKILPVVLSRSEIEKVLESAKNAKYRLLLSLAYGAGLRVSEFIALKV